MTLIPFIRLQRRRPQVASLREYRAPRVESARVRRALPPPEAWLVALAAAGLATEWSAVHHSMLLYGDARAHLDVARRVTDGLTPGLAQLGSVWLPLPHILLVPLVAITPLWHNGAAGAIVGGACFVYAALRVFSLVEELSGSRLAAWCGFAVFVLNLNMLVPPVHRTDRTSSPGLLDRGGVPPGPMDAHAWGSGPVVGRPSSSSAPP